MKNEFITGAVKSGPLDICTNAISNEASHIYALVDKIDRLVEYLRAPEPEVATNAAAPYQSAEVNPLATMHKNGGALGSLACEVCAVQGARERLAQSVNKLTSII